MPNSACANNSFVMTTLWGRWTRCFKVSYLTKGHRTPNGCTVLCQYRTSTSKITREMLKTEAGGHPPQGDLPTSPVGITAAPGRVCGGSPSQLHGAGTVVSPPTF